MDSSLLRKFVNYGQKSFITLGKGVVKLFVRNLRIFVIGWSVTLESFYSLSNTSLVRKYVNHGQKSLITLAPACIVAIRTFSSMKEV